MFILTFIQINPHLYQLTFNSLYIWMNPCSFYTTIYGIETYHFLFNLWQVALLLYPGVRGMCDKHLLCSGIYIVPVNNHNAPFPCSWYQSWFACLVGVLFGASRRSWVEWVDSAVFLPLLVCTDLLYASLFGAVFKSLSSDNTLAILLLIFFLSTSLS